MNAGIMTCPHLHKNLLVMKNLLVKKKGSLGKRRFLGTERGVIDLLLGLYIKVKNFGFNSKSLSSKRLMPINIFNKN